MITVQLSSLSLASEGVFRFQHGRQSYFVIVDSAGSPTRVLLDKCAHRGDSLHPTLNGFQCVSHGWTYSTEGLNTSTGRPGLTTVPFELRGTELRLLTYTAEVLDEAGQEDSLDGSETLELLAHASFFLTAGETRLLFDPWLVGNTYWGAWQHYPRHHVNIENLSPTHVAITHPHPDHFHLPTLNRLERSVQVLIPDFPSRILQRELSRLGFQNVTVLEWEKQFSLDTKVRMAFLRPISFFEDASCVVGVGDWFWLNQNDAGAALKDECLPERIDLLTMSFDIGASGWPLTWEREKTRNRATLKAQRLQHFESIKSRCRQTNARFYAPFAGWWRHAFDIHEKFAREIPHTTHDDLKEILQGENTDLLPTLPSSVINLRDMTHEWNRDVAKQLHAAPHPEVFSRPELNLDAKELRSRLRAHMGDLTKLSLATACEPVDFVVSVPEIDFEEKFHFGGEQEVITTVSVEIPAWVAEAIVSDDSTATWDHFDIGYWCKWSRVPDVYPPNFTRLLALGYAQEIFSDKRSFSEDSVLRRSVADFVDIDPITAKTILNRAGLPCVACNRANADSLANAFEIHGVPENLRTSAAAELAALLTKDVGESLEAQPQ